MKKIFPLLLLAVFALATYAQINTRYLRINKLDNTTIEIPVAEIDSIDFITKDVTDTGTDTPTPPDTIPDIPTPPDTIPGTPIIPDTISEHEYVDLGLPSGTLWATCNVGASSPEGYGDYFAWGETEPKEDYSWETYKHCQGNASTLTKYCPNEYYGIVDNKTTLEPLDDAATVNWGSNWRTPTLADLLELHNHCTWESVGINSGQYGYRVIGKNGNSIFLPAAGYYYGTTLYHPNEVGLYTSANLHEDSFLDASGFAFGKSGTQLRGARESGRTVRPVRSGSPSVTPNPTPIYDVVLDADTLMGFVTGAGRYEEGTDITISATAKEGYVFTSWSDGVTDNPRTITVTGDVTLTANFNAVIIEKPTYTVTVHVDDVMGSVTGAGTYTEDEVAVLIITANEGYAFTEWSDGVTDNPRIITVTEDVTLTANFEPESTTCTITIQTNSLMGYVTGAGTYEQGDTVTIMAVAYDHYKFTGWSDGIKTNPRTIIVTKDVTLTANFEYSHPIASAGHDYVDLGLPSGNLWVTHNIGASSPEGYGSYYLRSEIPMWSGNWRLPTRNDFQELINHCTWTWITLNGNKGFYVEGSNGHHIFLPAAGDYNAEGLFGEGTTGYYWAEERDDRNYGYYLAFYSTNKEVTSKYGGIYVQMTVRPVCSGN